MYSFKSYRNIPFRLLPKNFTCASWNLCCVYLRTCMHMSQCHSKVNCQWDHCKRAEMIIANKWSEWMIEWDGPMVHEWWSAVSEISGLKKRDETREMISKWMAWMNDWVIWFNGPWNDDWHFKCDKKRGEWGEMIKKKEWFEWVIEWYGPWNKNQQSVVSVILSLTKRGKLRREA